ncbi:MAG: DUF2933 domain-containing protein [Anaerolineaceae bacterium]|nr:DUF2933 domain-containing protein [Anaerolineaceae bacterium]
MSKKHAIWMALCCVVGMGAVAAIFLLRIPTSNVVTIGLLLICPLSHVAMMAFMGKNHDHDHGSTEDAAHHQTPMDVKAKPSSPRNFLSGQD